MLMVIAQIMVVVSLYQFIRYIIWLKFIKKSVTILVFLSLIAENPAVSFFCFFCDNFTALTAQLPIFQLSFSDNGHFSSLIHTTDNPDIN